MRLTICVALALVALILSSCVNILTGAGRFDITPETPGPKHRAPEIYDPGVPDTIVAGEKTVLHRAFGGYPWPELVYDLGGGATYEETLRDGQITGLAPGTYHGSLTATNQYGQDVQTFTYTVVSP